MTNKKEIDYVALCREVGLLQAKTKVYDTMSTLAKELCNDYKVKADELLEKFNSKTITDEEYSKLCDYLSLQTAYMQFDTEVIQKALKLTKDYEKAHKRFTDYKKSRKQDKN